VDRSDIRLVPYQTLFHAGIREALGLSLRDCYIEIDEAHNLVDALNALDSDRISNEMIQITHGRLLLFQSLVGMKPVGNQLAIKL
jgi:chromosome transmission fidelity protein 1